MSTAGDELELMPPAGVFCERPGDGPVIAFCGGSGVTPVFSIVKQVLHGGTRSVRFFYANRDADSVIFRDALAELEAAHRRRLTVHHHLDERLGIRHRRRRRRVPCRLVTGRDGRRRRRARFICGPTPFMDLVEQGAFEAGHSRREHRDRTLRQRRSPRRAARRCRPRRPPRATPTDEPDDHDQEASATRSITSQATRCSMPHGGPR